MNVSLKLRGAIACLCLLNQVVAAAPQLSIPPVVGSPGATVLVPIQLTTDVPLIAAQFDLIFDGTRFTSGSPTGGSALNGHVVASSTPTPGVRRVVVYSVSNALLQNGSLVTIPITVAADTVPSAATLVVTNAILALTNGTGATQIALSNGVLTISSASAPRLSTISRALDGTVQLQLVGTLGQTYILQSSPDLKQWTNVRTNVLSAIPWTYTESTAVTLRQRFYRAVSAP